MVKRAGVRVRVRLRGGGGGADGKGEGWGVSLFEVTEMFWKWRCGSCSFVSNL